ncbi:uncharacterized protein LOC114533763 [Dendronephthya gigantea]|uniref:uncharacterized protein LOC114533763 n=1 Tax=Dendronephthya gigantea TaxID=151771 RepID=UPI00106B0BC0|nr:uncharacterized protein LOC114533763 [Dendronephthya gigantea]
MVSFGKFGILCVVFMIMFTVKVRAAPNGGTYDEKDLKEKISFFNSDEHDTIGSSVTLPNALGITSILTLPNGVAVPFSKIVALAGDFFGVPDTPIIDPAADGTQGVEREKRRKRFLAAFGTLAFDKGKDLPARVQKLVKMIDEDHKAIKSGGKLHTDAEWDKATGGFWAGGLPVKFGGMLSLATKNFDHFQPQATQAYLAGHELAVLKAREAAKDSNAVTKKGKLMEAYALDAFAAHFLTDSFSAGHIRTPRVELHNKVIIQNIGDYLSKFMHDEDCKYGLRVKNKKGKEWISYGDKYLMANGNKENLGIVNQAIQKSVLQVYEAFKNPASVINPNEVIDFVPFVNPAAVNNAPLFQMKQGQLLRRLSVKNLQDQQTKSDWWGVPTATMNMAQGSDRENSALPSALFQ